MTMNTNLNNENTEVLTDSILSIPCFCAWFCCDCPNLRYDSGTMESMPEDVCLCGFDVTDRRCCRNGDWLKITALLDKVADILTETWVHD